MNFFETEYDIPESKVGISPNESFNLQNDQMYSYAIKADASNGLARGITEGYATNVVGVGYRLQSKIKHQLIPNLNETKAYDLQRKIEDIWQLGLESKLIDVTGNKTLHQLALIAYKTQLITGNSFVLLNTADNIMGFNIKILDSAYLVNNSLMRDNLLEDDEIEGIVRNKNGIVTDYRFYKHHPYAKNNTSLTDYVTIPKRKNKIEIVLHLFDVHRAGVLAGVPIVIRVARVLEDLKEYTKAEIDASKLNAHFAGIIYNDNFESMMQENNTSPEIKIGKGNLFSLPQGWKIDFANPSRPNKDYGKFIETKIKELCIAINYPYEMFMKQFTSSYSASRGAVIEGQKNFKIHRFNMKQDFYTPIYIRFLQSQIGKGTIRLNNFSDKELYKLAYSSCNWVNDAQEDMNKVNVVNASVKAIEAGLSTRDREAKIFNGTDFSDNISTAKIETEMLKKSGLVKTDDLKKARMKK